MCRDAVEGRGDVRRIGNVFFSAILGIASFFHMEEANNDDNPSYREIVISKQQRVTHKTQTKEISQRREERPDSQDRRYEKARYFVMAKE